MVALESLENTFILLLLLQNEMLYTHGRLFTGKRRTQDARTRFQQRINSLGPDKIKLLRQGRIGKSRALPTGFELVGGEVVDTTNKVLQKKVLGGTAYYSFNDKATRKPLYTRSAKEFGWNFVVFQDPFYWRGSGHLILLKKVLGINISKSRYEQVLLYDAYTISLRVSMHPRVQLRDPIYRKKLQTRRKNYNKVMNKRQRMSKPGFQAPHLKGSKGKREKRKKRELSASKIYNLIVGSGGDCVLKKLNTTQVLLRIKKQTVLASKKAASANSTQVNSTQNPKILNKTKN